MRTAACGGICAVVQHPADIGVGAGVDVDREGRDRRVGDRLDRGDLLAGIALAIRVDAGDRLGIDCGLVGAVRMRPAKARRSTAWPLTTVLGRAASRFGVRPGAGDRDRLLIRRCAGWRRRWRAGVAAAHCSRADVPPARLRP